MITRGSTLPLPMDCVASLFILGSFEPSRSRDNPEEGENRISSSPATWFMAPLGHTGDQEPAHTWMCGCRRGEHTRCYCVIHFLPPAGELERSLQLSARRCGAPGGAWLSCTDVQISPSGLTQARSLQSQCSRVIKCLSCLLL